MVAGKVGIPPNYIEKFHGQVDVETFCDRLIIPLSERAQDILDKVWSLVDFNDTDEADLEELRQRYDSRRWHNGCIYIGRYTDPNHPGGLRDFRLLDEVDSEGRRKAQVIGTGGEDEPSSYTLPAWVLPSGSVVVDFSVEPKNGPKNLHGKWDKNGIFFSTTQTKAKSKWPKVPETRADNFAGFLENFDCEANEPLGKWDFYKYFAEVQMSFASDDDFVTFLKHTWGVVEDNSSYDFKAELTTIFSEIQNALIYKLGN